MNLSRRRFLQSSLGGSTMLSLGLAAPRFLQHSAGALASPAANPAGRVLVVVQLAGGNDGLNTVIPYRDPEYARNRVALRINANQVLKVDGDVGLHPQLAPLAALWEQQRLAIVQGVGYPNPNRSHFESMDIWQSCHRGAEPRRTGWLGRTLDELPAERRSDLAALHLGRGELPLALAARHTAVPSAPSLDAFQLRTTSGALGSDALRELAATAVPQEAVIGNTAEDSLASFLRQTTLTALDASDKVKESLAAEAAATPYPASGLAAKLKTISQLIDAGLACPIYYVSLDGFDTHASQGAAHASLLNELSAALGAFTTDLKARGHADRVLVMTFSEFGRRVKENASLGTDHGAAAPMFLLGTKVKAGCVGAHPSLTDLDQGDLKHHTDFRQVYAAVLENWLACPSEAVLGGRFAPANVLPPWLGRPGHE